MAASGPAGSRCAACRLPPLPACTVWHVCALSVFDLRKRAVVSGDSMRWRYLAVGLRMWDAGGIFTKSGAPRAAGFHKPRWVHEDGVRHPCSALSGACCGMSGGLVSLLGSACRVWAQRCLYSQSELWLSGCLEESRCCVYVGLKGLCGHGAWLQHLRIEGKAHTL